MPEKHDQLAAILAAKTEHQGNPCVCNGIAFAADIMAVHVLKTVIDATMVAIIA